MDDRGVSDSNCRLPSGCGQPAVFIRRRTRRIFGRRRPRPRSNLRPTHLPGGDPAIGHAERQTSAFRESAGLCGAVFCKRNGFRAGAHHIGTRRYAGLLAGL